MHLLEQTETFIFELFKDKLSATYSYHNFNHTLRVVQAAQKIMESETLPKEEMQWVLLACWFHDTGYISGIENHELSSVEIAQNFLKDKISDEALAQVTRLILVTHVDAVPVSLDEKIIKDADFNHFADENYFDICELLRDEWLNTKELVFTDLAWFEENKKFMLTCHRYHTDFAKQHWQALKEKNLFEVEKQIRKLKALNIENVVKKNKALKTDRPDRGIETMFRVALNNHIRLSEIADSKANILLSVNAIIISIALSTLIPKLDSASNAHLVLPTLIMILFSVVSIIFAIISTRPKVTSGTFTRKDIEDQSVNLLFFGNFYKMPYDDYLYGLHKVMESREFLYDTLIKDLYHLGLVLNKKYKWLRITYTVFMAGIILSVISFVFAFLNLKAS